MNALVIGAGISGLGCARLLNSESYDVTLVSNRDFSSRKECEAIGIKVYLDDQDMSLVKDYDLVVKSPGIPNDHPLVSQFTNVIDEIEVAWRFTKDSSYYAISGTNGKTTTSSLLFAMLQHKSARALLAGNVGVSLSESVLKDRGVRDVALEISAFQLEQCPTFAPKVFGLLNLTPDHLDRYDSVEDYYGAKLSVLDRVGTFIRNCDDVEIVKRTQNTTNNVINISLLTRENMDVYRQDEAIYFKDVKLFDLSDLRLVGEHNIMNASFAALMAYLAGVDLKDIVLTLRSFGGVEHRCEYVRTIDGVRFYNDSKATNPESCVVCLNAFKAPTILLAGGYDKKISFDILKPFAKTLKAVYLFGESALQLKEIFPDALIVDSMDSALDEALEIVEFGDVVVLSPACASYDQFDNFEQRGDIFKNLVNNIT